MTTAANEREIRQLIERYAGAVDQSDAATAAGLVTIDGMLDHFVATHHVIGSAVVTVDGDHANGSTQCTAHHLESDGAGFVDRVVVITYLDESRQVDDQWQIARRELRVKWTSVLPVESA